MWARFKIWIEPAILVCFVLTICWLSVSLYSERADHAIKVSHLNLQISTMRLDYAEKSLTQEKEYRAKERNWQNEINAQTLATAKAEAVHAVALSSLRATNNRLSADVAANIASRRGAPYAANPALEREAASSQILLYAELYSSARNEAIEYADIADRSFTAGTGCERAYDSTE